MGIASIENLFQTTPEGKVKGCQLKLGKARKTVEVLTNEHVTKVDYRAQAREALDRACDDGADTAAASRLFAKAESDVNQSEALLNVAKQRVAQAEDDLRLAEQLEKDAREQKTGQHFKYEIGTRGDQVIADLKRFVYDELVPGLSAYKAVCRSDARSNAITAAQLEFGRFLLLAVQPLLKEVLSVSRAASPALTKFKQWSDSIPDPNSFRN